MVTIKSIPDSVNRKLLAVGIFYKKYIYIFKWEVCTGTSGDARNADLFLIKFTRPVIAKS